MAYSKFKLKDILTQFSLTLSSEVFFDEIKPLEYSDWLKISLERAQKQGYSSEKERSERLIHPVLAELQDINNYTFSFYSGRNLDIEPLQGLVGECDYILSLGNTIDMIQSPIFTLVEAKEESMDWGIRQCAAQMIGAKLFNENEGHAAKVIYGCATIGEVWRLMRLENDYLFLDKKHYYLNNIGELLGALQRIIDHCKEMYK